MTLFENGIDYIQIAIVAFFATSPSARDYKYCVLHAFSGTLLILKERLRREHAALIWTDVKNLNENTAETVNFKTLLDRLEHCASVRLLKHDRDLLESVRLLRNKIEHYEYELNEKEVTVLLGGLVEFLERFLQDHLGHSLERVVPTHVWVNIAKLESIAKRISEERIKKEEADFLEWKTRATKYSKWSKPKLTDFANNFTSCPRTKDELDSVDAMECGVCGEHTVYVAPKDADVGLCVNLLCRAVRRLDACAKCSNICVGELCDYCKDYLDYQMSQD